MQTILVSNIDQGIAEAKKILYEKVDTKTALFLSGGKSPKPLYQNLAQEKKLHPAAVALIDERYGEPLHENSNEKMLQETGLLSYFQKEQIPFHPILQRGVSRKDTALQYDKTVRKLLSQIPKSVGIVSIGVDGHTAGIVPNREDFRNPLFVSDKGLLVSEFNDPTGPFGERITVTFQGLSMIDWFLLWVFGEEKKEALQKIFTKGSLEEVPGRFYLRDEIAKKTIVITDIRV